VDASQLLIHSDWKFRERFPSIHPRSDILVTGTEKLIGLGCSWVRWWKRLYRRILRDRKWGLWCGSVGIWCL